MRVPLPRATGAVWTAFASGTAESTGAHDTPTISILFVAVHASPQAGDQHRSLAEAGARAQQGVEPAISFEILDAAESGKHTLNRAAPVASAIATCSHALQARRFSKQELHAVKSANKEMPYCSAMRRKRNFAGELSYQSYEKGYEAVPREKLTFKGSEEALAHGVIIGIPRRSPSTAERDGGPTPGRNDGSRLEAAASAAPSSASSTNWVASVVAIDQPTTRRLKASSTTAT
jgi:hypothetical protein